MTQSTQQQRTRPEEGSIGEFLNFLQQVTARLDAASPRMGTLIPPLSCPLGPDYVNYFREHHRGPLIFRLAGIIWPKAKQARFNEEPDRKPTGKQQHGILICKFFAEFFALYKNRFTYKEIYQMFLHDFCKLDTQGVHKWMKNFDLHFISEDAVPETVDGWKQFLIADHTSDLSGLKELPLSIVELANDNPTELDPKEDLGFLAVNPKRLRDYCAKLVSANVV